MIQLSYQNVNILYRSHKTVETCVSFSFATNALLPIYLYQKISIDGSLIDLCIVLEILKTNLFNRFPHLKCIGRTFNGLFIFSIQIIGSPKQLEDVIKGVFEVISTPLTYVQYVKMCKATKLEPNNDSYRTALFSLENSIARQIWVLITGKSIFQEEYKNGDKGRDKLRKLFEKKWSLPSLGICRNSFKREEILWQTICKVQIWTICCNFESIFTQIVLFATLKKKLLFPLTAEGFSPAVEPSGKYIYYRTRYPMEKWLTYEEVVYLLEEKDKEEWIHWGNCNAVINTQQIYQDPYHSFKHPEILREIKKYGKIVL